MGRRGAYLASNFRSPASYHQSAIQNLSSTSIGDPKSAIHNPKLQYGFTVASYDKSHDLIIDPLLASTYLGGSGSDYGGSGYSLALDTSGNVYVTGETYSTNFPTTSGAYNNNSNGSGFNDVFVSKLNGGLTSLLASTFLGVVSGVGGGYSLSLDTSGNVYVTGGTYSTNFPTTSGAYNTSKTGSGSDVFVSKLDGGLTSLLASTYLGGSGGDYGYSLTLDTSGNVYVTGETESSNFPTTNGAYNTSPNGDSDVFVSKLDSGLTSLLASTYLGGSGGDYRGSLAIDTSGNVYVTGSTGSSDFPTTSGSYENSRNITYSDVFVSKFNGGLTSLLASTYLGGSNYDWGYSLAIDTSGNVYVTGTTYSTDFPTTSGAYDTSQTGGGSNDVFVSKLDSSLSGSKPTATTGSSTNVTLSSATLNGTVNANGPSTTAWFNYGTSVGSYTGTSTTQSVSGSSDTLVSIGIGGLSPGTTYYYRIAAQNITGITYGDEMSFITLSDTSGSQGSISGYVIDIKGNPIGNAKVRLKRGNIAEKTASDEDGFFEFEDLDAGTYVVIVRKRRYKISRKTVKLKDNEDIEIEIKMKKQ